MYTVIPCAAGCGRPAIAGARTCAFHAADPAVEAERLAERIISRKTIKDLNAPALEFVGMHGEGRHLYGCNFKEAAFIDCVFSGALMRMVFFDCGRFLRCDFRECDLQFVSFGGCCIEACTFQGSELLHDNFTGASITNTSFDDSNLYNSRFINSTLDRVSFSNCNIKRVNFFKATQERVSFRSANTQEAIFDMIDPF